MSELSKYLLDLQYKGVENVQLHLTKNNEIITFLNDDDVNFSKEETEKLGTFYLNGFSSTREIDEYLDILLGEVVK